MEIGRRLSELRKKNGYTQKQLADALNLSQQIVSNIERNTTAPDVEFLHGAADLYKISLDELVGRKTLITEESSYEQQILNVVETMDDTKKELSLRLLNEVAQQRGDKDGDIIGWSFGKGFKKLDMYTNPTTDHGLLDIAVAKILQQLLNLYIRCY